MDLVVFKSGPEMLDAVHAYGTALAVACAFNTRVEVKNEGLLYRLNSATPLIPEVIEADFLKKILALPTLEQLPVDKKDLPENDLALANFDGLLAASFTAPGIRFVSLSDLLNDSQRLKNGPKALDKVNDLVTRLEKFIERVSKGSSAWFQSALGDYAAASPVFPVIGRKWGLTVPLTVDPALGYSTYRAISDGQIGDKINVTLRQPKFAALFVMIGAARFLRAQRVGGKLVNFYVPIADSLIIQPETFLPVLNSTDIPSSQAVLYEWLSRSAAGSSERTWSGLAYQTLQTQGGSQSISIDRGCLTYPWLNTLEKRLGLKMSNYWKLVLRLSPRQRSFEMSGLIDMLLNRRSSAWLSHLRELALSSLDSQADYVRPYTLKELREVTRSMDLSNHTSPLSTILEREEGTLQFGRALRRLGEVSGHTLVQMIGQLDAAKTADQMIRVAALIAQHCKVVSARSKFMIIPDEADLNGLLADLHQFGPKSLANILIALSFVQYPGVNRSKNALRHRMMTRANRLRIKAQANRMTARRSRRRRHAHLIKRRNNVH